MHPVIKLFNYAVVVLTGVFGVPINLYLLFVKRDVNGAFGLIVGIAAIYFVTKVFDLNKGSADHSDD